MLYHLCNPDVPKFLSTCSNCYKEIHSGDRYHCETCTDFDLCKARNDAFGLFLLLVVVLLLLFFVLFSFFLLSSGGMVKIKLRPHFHF